MKGCIHLFQSDVSEIPLPKVFSDPFCYVPHPLCIKAAEEVQAYIGEQVRWREELRQGKMFGVLLVQTEVGSIGYLAAYSGLLDHANSHPFFVPPVYDLLDPKGFFTEEETVISHINTQIDALEKDAVYLSLKEKLRAQTALATETLRLQKMKDKLSKQERERLRTTSSLLSEADKAQMIRDSQHQKAETKRLERSLKAELECLQKALSIYAEPISQLKMERKQRSACLQRQLFDQFQMLNAYGKRKGLCELFQETPSKMPPAGAGECAAPKLLQYAYLNGLKPLSMAEFWWGNSPSTVIRKHGQYYPACKGKCTPILIHMLQGLKMGENPLLDTKQYLQVGIVYEDSYLIVVEKPAGLLSVPGKEEADSVYRQLQKRAPQSLDIYMVHRLDMDTSGLLVVAKTKEVYKHLQAQFAERSVNKRYIAWLDGVLQDDRGEIDLPLCPNVSERPLQMVHPIYGKPSHTRYEVLERVGGRTKVAFYPSTGRTHQLRVHAAHPLGLNAPIVGDRLYGKVDKRLMLHAAYIQFVHPISGKMVSFQSSESL